MLSKIFTAAITGLDGNIIDVEADIRKGNAYFSIVGLADKSVQEAKDRIPSAIRNSGFRFIPMKMVINLAPAEILKSGSMYDLPIAIAYLQASEQLNFDSDKKLFVGELSLDGKVRPVKGILPIVDVAKQMGFEEVFVPFENRIEASLVKDIKINPVQTLLQVAGMLEGQLLFPEEVELPEISNESKYEDFDFLMIKGQQQSKRALEIAAAGGHNILFSGVPGSGKTLLSKCLVSILPEMSYEEQIEVTRIYSVAGLTKKDRPLLNSRPFRSPHHTASPVALIGGGTIPRPGEITLAHNGVLFLDEFPEFSMRTIEALRQPLEEKVVTVSRANASFTFPANFIFVASMNPCKCGYFGDQDRECSCSHSEITKYQKRISGPIIDRIDLQVHVSKVSSQSLSIDEGSESSESIRKRVQKARNIQLKRFVSFEFSKNGDMNQTFITKNINLSADVKSLLSSAVSKLNLSARSYFRIIKVARTIADLESSKEIQIKHIQEALSFRFS